MRPFLRSGSLVGVEWIDASSPQAVPGDLVLCRDGSGDWILHRLLAREGTRWIVKGDAGFLSETFELPEVWGRAISIRPPGGHDTQPFARGALDSLIARVSLSSLHTGKTSAYCLRKVTRCLSWLRRWL